MDGLDRIRESFRHLFTPLPPDPAGGGTPAGPGQAPLSPAAVLDGDGAAEASAATTGEERTRSIGELSESLEDYLEILFQLLEQRKVARVKDIARLKGVKTASVSMALKRLAREGLVRYQAREFVELTASGAELARKVVDRHEFLRRFLRDILLIDAEVAEIDACAIEHQISTQTLERMACFFQWLMASAETEPAWLNRFRADCAVAPPLPEARQHLPEPLPLSQLAQGEVGRVVRLLAAAPIRQRLVEMGVLPNVLIEMDGASPLGDPIRLKIRGFRLSLRRSEAETILVQREPPP